VCKVWGGRGSSETLVSASAAGEDGRSCSAGSGGETGENWKKEDECAEGGGQRDAVGVGVAESEQGKDGKSGEVL